VATTTARTQAQTLTLVIGAVFLLVGIAGFFVTGFKNFAEPSDATLLIFDVNPLHNIVHLLLGAAGVSLARTVDGARTYGMLLAVGYGLAFIYGLVAVGNKDLNFLNINQADNILHILSALAGVAIVMMSRRPATT
jgi:ABC-type transport system involved in multi-copper enzyme maturation permease subunit